jgi:L-asparaginase
MPTLTVPDGELPSVALIKMCLGCDGRLVDNLEGMGYRGLVIEGFGGGHVPAHIVPSVDRLATRIPVVLASRTGGGELLQETYGFPGSERDLLGRGLIAAGFLDGLKARILLALLLAEDRDTAAIRRAFSNFNSR